MKNRGESDMSSKNREWSCEHCGRPTVDAWHDCAENGCAMCLRCTDAQDDDGEPCPVEVPQSVAMLEAWECHALGCACRHCQPGHPDHKRFTGATLPTQMLYVSLAPGAAAPDGWRKVRRTDRL